MGISDDYYDFHCGNDPRLVKIAIINDHFHTITIRANVAKTIDFSGGTRRVETIRLNKCFKTTRIIWPERTGDIRRLFIFQSDALTKLDVSALTSLEELSILNCRSLEEVIGLSDSLKEINIHNAKLNTLDVSRLHKLQKINLATSASHVKLNLENLDELQIAAITTNKIAADKNHHSEINLSKCHSLHTVYIDSGDNLLDLNISNCTGLQEAAILCGKTSKLTGLQDCKNLEFFHTSTSMEMNELSSILAKKFKAGNPTEKLESHFDMTQEFYDAAKQTKAGIHDRETIIQEIGSQVEVDKANAAKIMLLGTPLDVQLAMNKKDLSKELRQVMLDNTYFPPAPLSPLYFLPKTVEGEYAELGIPASRIVKKQNPMNSITSWLENPERLTPNLLLIEQNVMNTPSVLKFLKQFRTNPNILIHANKRYTLRPYDKIILKGDWYRLKNLAPAISKKINLIPLAALAAPAIASIFASKEALSAYQAMLEEANNLITQRMMESNRTLSHRSKNIKTLKQAAEMKRLAREFFYYLEQLQPQAGMIRNLDIPPQSEIRYDTPDSQDSIDAKSIDTKQPGVNKNLDFTPQHEIHYDPPDDQYNIHAAAKEPPELRGKKAPQEPIDTPPDLRGKKAPQEPIDTPPDLRGKKAPQEPIDTPPDLRGKKAPQEPIDTPPDLRGKKALQTGINKEANAQPFSEARGIQPQRAVRKNDEWTPQTRVDNDPGPVMIDAAATSATPPPLDEYEQLLLGADKAARQIIATVDDQLLIDAAKGLADEVKKLKDAGPFNASCDPQRLLAAAHVLSDLLDNSHLLTEPVNDQQLLSANAVLKNALQKTPSLFPASNQQRLLDAAKKVADSVKQMTENADGLPEQILIDASSEASPANELKLLDASRKLAEAMQKLAATACAIDTSKSSPSAKAANIVVEASIKELKKDTRKSSLLDAAGELIIGMKLLAMACRNELPQTEISEISLNKEPELRTSIFKILQNAHREYVKDHDLLNPGSNLFGRTPGKEEIRAEILAKFVDALINVKSLEPHTVDKDFAKLMKDTGLKYALGGIEIEIKECLTGMKRPKPQPSPSNKLDNID